MTAALRRLRWIPAGIVVLSWAALAWSAPITFNTALPVAKGHAVLREQLFVSRLDEDATGGEREVRVVRIISALGYGATPRLAVFGVLPYLVKRLERNMGSTRIMREAKGIGDLVVFGRYTAFQDDAPGRTFRLAPFLGLKTPTGRNDEKDGFGKLPPNLQPGTASWDLFAGIVATYQTLAFQIDAQAGYRDNREADGVEFGDVAAVDASLQYRLWPRTFTGGGVPDFLYGVLEANWARQAKTRVGQVEDPDSGGTTLLLSPGLQYVTRKWIFETAVQVPAVQNLNGAALETEVIVSAGFRVNL